MFHLLREEGAIVPVAKLRERDEPPQAGETISSEQEEEDRRTEPIPEEQAQNKRFILLDPEEKRTLLEKLRSIADTVSKDEKTAS